MGGVIGETNTIIFYRFFSKCFRLNPPVSDNSIEERSNSIMSLNTTNVSSFHGKTLNILDRETCDATDGAALSTDDLSNVENDLYEPVSPTCNPEDESEPAVCDIEANGDMNVVEIEISDQSQPNPGEVNECSIEPSVPDTFYCDICYKIFISHLARDKHVEAEHAEETKIGNEKEHTQETEATEETAHAGEVGKTEETELSKKTEHAEKNNHRGETKNDGETVHEQETENAMIIQHVEGAEYAV